LWPFCPPLALPDGSRRLPAIRGFFFSPSLEGGFELVELSCPKRRFSSATSARSAAISARSAAISSSTSARRIIPALTHIQTPASQSIRNPPALSSELWQIGLTK
jgi:hypothetical protein